MAHIFTLSDARGLVEAGVDVLGHSIRDSLVNAAFLALMKAKGVVYIPTLTLDIFATAYGAGAPWINDPFFIHALEPGVYAMLTDTAYSAAVRNSPVYRRNLQAVETARKNLLLIAQAGITIVLGTDSGALPVRTQGFAEHLEMEKMVAAGMSPAAVLRAATVNAAAMLDMASA
ncbi:MAG: amidohydrolase family protein, partial [Flavihumibacter sp.]